MKVVVANRRVLYFLAVLILSVSAGTGFPVSAVADGNIAHDGVNYRVISEIGKVGMVEVVPTPNYSGDLVIPNAFIANGVEYTVLDISERAFAGCTNLTSVVMPDSIETIGMAAFESCEKLTSVKISGHVKTIGDYAFNVCSSLASVTIPDLVETIGAGVFNNCIALNAITIPESVTTIGYSVFTNCPNLASIEVDKNNPHYSSQNGVLFDKTKKVLVKYPEGKQDVQYKVPDGVTSIENVALYGCPQLTSIRFPSSLETIEGIAGNWCFNISSIEVDHGNPNFVSKDGVLFNKDMTTLVLYPPGKQGGYTIPATVKRFQDFAFTNISGLSSVTLPQGLENIGIQAFQSCGFRSITIPASVKNIDIFAFSGTLLQNITFSGMMPPAFQDNVFWANASLTRIFVPAGAKANYTKALAGQVIDNSDNVEIKLLDKVEIIELGEADNGSDNPHTGA